MKKGFIGLLALLLMLASLSCAALADGLSLPEMSDCVDGVMIDAKDDSIPLYIYAFADVDAMADALFEYIALLDEHFGFSEDKLTMDDTSSEDMIYFCLTEYTGDAPIKPERMGYCDTEAYLQFAVVGGQDGYVLSLMAADGIDFFGDLPEPFTEEEGTKLMDPAYFSDYAVHDAGRAIFDGQYANSYHYEGNGNGLQHFDVAQKYMQALIDSGYYKLVSKETYKDATWYRFEYVGSKRLRELNDPSLSEGDLEVYVTTNMMSLTMNPDLSLIH